MKKIIIVISLVIMMPCVFAKESHVKYKYYKINRVYGPYAEASDEFPLLDTEDYIYSDYVTSTNLEEKEGREFSSREVWEYERVKDVNYITIINHTDDASIREITVKFNGEKIDYDIYGDVDNFKKSSSISLYLSKKVDPTKLEIYIKTNLNYSDMSFIIGCDEVDYAELLAGFADEYYFYGRYASYKNGDIWTIDYYDDIQPSSRIMRFIGNKTLYTYRDKLYHSYKEVKEYYPEYLTGPIYDYTFRDEEDFIIEESKTSSQFDEKNELLDNDVVIIDVPNTSISYETITGNLIRNSPY